MPNRKLLSCTDRNCRPAWHRFQPQGGKEYTVHSIHTLYKHLAGSFWVLRQNLQQVAPNQEKPQTTPFHYLTFLFIYQSAYSPPPPLHCVMSTQVLCDLTYRLYSVTSPTDCTLWPHLQIALCDLTYKLYSVTSPKFVLCGLTYRLYSVTSPIDCTLWHHLQIVLCYLTFRLYSLT